MRLYWLASYPKSGNTWVRFLLHQYLYGDVTDTPSLSRRIPDLHRGEAKAAAPDAQGRLLVKLHAVYTPDLPYMEHAAGCIYVARHPRDVLLSCMHYMRMTGGLPANISDEMYASRFIAEGGDPWMTSVGFGTWDQNVLGWTTLDRFPVLTLRYEDLRSDTAGSLAKMLEHLGVAPEATRLKRAVDGSTFERMRALEVEEKASGKETTVWAGSRQEMRRGMYFMNRGRSGRSLSGIAPDLDRLLEQRFGEAMRRVGYATAG